MTEELKPCPFCGGTPKMQYIGNERTMSRRIIIKCTVCRIQRTDAAILHDFSWLKKLAIEQWNQRVEK